MPTILYVQGWRFHSYEGNEPMHVHAIKGDAECVADIGIPGRKEAAITP